MTEANLQPLDPILRYEVSELDLEDRTSEILLEQQVLDLVLVVRGQVHAQHAIEAPRHNLGCSYRQKQYQKAKQSK